MLDTQMSSISFYLHLSSSIYSVPSPGGEALSPLPFPILSFVEGYILSKSKEGGVRGRLNTQQIPNLLY